MGLPRTRVTDSPKGKNVKRMSSFFETNTGSNKDCIKKTKEAPKLKIAENSILARRRAGSPRKIASPVSSIEP